MASTGDHKSGMPGRLKFFKGAPVSVCYECRKSLMLSF